MQLFYAHIVTEQQAFFDAEESAHCLQVLRKNVGAELHFTDGKGGLYLGKMINSNKKGAEISIISKIPNNSFKLPQLHIAIAPTKNMDRLEWFLEKATEMGATEFTLLLCQHSERKHLRTDRLQKIILSAMKQSLQTHLPKLNEAVDFQQFILSQKEKNNQTQKFIAYCNDTELSHLKHKILPQKDGLVLIGPEGDFSESEIAIAKNQGFVGVSLGATRLRTETAGLAACQIFNLCNIL